MTSIGPQIPGESSSNEPDEGSDDDFMPQLPPDLIAAANSNNDCRFIERDDDEGENDDKAESDGKDATDSDDEDDDDDVIGPLPPTEEEERRSKMSVAQEIESRNQKMKDKLTGKDEKPQEREAWMTELPDLVRKNFGLVARGFRKDAGPSGEGRQEWTETPADRERRKLEAIERGKRREAEGKKKREDDDDDDDDSDSDEGKKKKKNKKKSKKHKRERDKEEKIRKEVDKYNEKKRGESLLEIHRKKLEKKKEKEKKKKGDKPAERVPFSREKDLEVNKFDDAKRNRLIKASAQLNTRFNHGETTSSFL